jgi:hypothetical protein
MNRSPPCILKAAPGSSNSKAEKDHTSESLTTEIKQVNARERTTRTCGQAASMTPSNAPEDPVHAIDGHQGEAVQIAVPLLSRRQNVDTNGTRTRTDVAKNPPERFDLCQL